MLRHSLLFFSNIQNLRGILEVLKICELKLPNKVYMLKSWDTVLIDSVSFKLMRQLTNGKK